MVSVNKRLQWTALCAAAEPKCYTLVGEGRRLGLIVHHTDADREYAYDRKSHVGTLDKTLDQADVKGWVIVDMKKDWETVFPPRQEDRSNLIDQGTSQSYRRHFGQVKNEQSI
jgi:hypothetical protein